MRGWSKVAVLGWMLGCSDGAARIEALEQEVGKLGEELRALKSASPGAAAGAFAIKCGQPWILEHRPLGAALWTCRAPEPSPDGVYPQCSVFEEPQNAIETKQYFERALHAAGQLHAIKNFSDKPIQREGSSTFEATYEAELAPVAIKSLGMLFPYREHTFTVSCFAPSAAFASYEKAFRQVIDSFAFN